MVVVVAKKERERKRRVEQEARSKLTTLSDCATCEGVGVVAAWVQLASALVRHSAQRVDWYDVRG